MEQEPVPADQAAAQAEVPAVAPDATATVCRILHVEDTSNTVFDFPEGDGEASLPGFGVVVLPIKVTVP